MAAVFAQFKNNERIRFIRAVITKELRIMKVKKEIILEKMTS